MMKVNFYNSLTNKVEEFIEQAKLTDLTIDTINTDEE